MNKLDFSEGKFFSKIEEYDKYMTSEEMSNKPNVSTASLVDINDIITDRIKFWQQKKHNFECNRDSQWAYISDRIISEIRGIKFRINEKIGEKTNG